MVLHNLEAASVIRDHSFRCAIHAVKWLSGDAASILHVDSDFRGFVDRVDTTGMRYVYPETTGYALSVFECLLCSGFEKLVDENYVRQTAAFLDAVLTANNGGAPGCGRIPENAQRLYTFDTGMAAKGLAAYAMRIGSTSRPSLTETMSFLLGAILENGEIAPLRKIDPASTDCRWSTQPGAYLLKAILGLICAMQSVHQELSRIALIENAIIRAIQSRDKKGMFLVTPGPHVNLHAHLYACEAVYFLGSLYEIPQAVDAANTGVEAVLELFVQEGHVPPVSQACGSNAERSDTVAQLIRLCLLLDLGSTQRLAELAHRLAGYQDRASGGLRFGTDFDIQANKAQSGNEHISTHSTLFALQAWLGVVSSDMVRCWRLKPWTFA